MFFTIEDYKKIQEWLSRNSIKDTEFNEAMQPFKGNEIISFVQNGHNTKAYLKDFVDQLFLLGIPDFVNITEKFDESNISLSRAIQLIPYKSRKIGQVITFLNEEGVWKIYQFKGKRKNQWNEESLWIDLIKDIASKITTLADEEDITTVEENGATVFKFKDKVYNPDNFSGKGRVYLRKNIVTVKDPDTGNTYKTNLLTQEMIGKENTIYIIQYDYNLNGQTITVPEGCVLQFEGGSIKNGKINFNDCLVLGRVILSNIINYTGLSYVYTSWFLHTDTQIIFSITNCHYYIDNIIENESNDLHIPDNCVLEFINNGYINGIIYSNKTKIINIPNSIDILGKIYNVEGSEITCRGDVIKRNTELLCAISEFPLAITSKVRNARALGISDFIIILHLDNSEGDNNVRVADTEPGGYTPELLKQFIELNNIEVSSIKFHTEGAYTDNGLSSFNGVCSFIKSYTQGCKDIGISFKYVHIINEEDAKLYWNNSEYIDSVIDLSNFIYNLGYVPRIAYQGTYGISVSNKLLYDTNIVPDFNYYPTLDFRDSKSQFSYNTLESLKTYYKGFNYIWGGKYTLSDLYITECGCLPREKALRNTSQWRTEYLGDYNANIANIFWKYIIELCNSIRFKGICIWFIEGYTEANVDRDYLYNLFLTLR